jgi:hypothetical protein
MSSSLFNARKSCATVPHACVRACMYVCMYGMYVFNYVTNFVVLPSIGIQKMNNYRESERERGINSFVFVN